MRLIVGCSSTIALVVFIIGLAVSLFITDASWNDRLTFAAMPSAIVFVAVLLLCSRDSARHSKTIRSVRTNLLDGDDSSDEQFLSSDPSSDTQLLLETRKAISRFFDVPTVKISRNVHLIRDLHIHKLEPSFQFYVVDSVIASQPVERKPFAFTMAGLESIDELTQAIRKVLDGFGETEETDDEIES